MFRDQLIIPNSSLKVQLQGLHYEDAASLYHKGIQLWWLFQCLSIHIWKFLRSQKICVLIALDTFRTDSMIIISAFHSIPLSYWGLKYQIKEVFFLFWIYMTRWWVSWPVSFVPQDYMENALKHHLSEGAESTVPVTASDFGVYSKTFLFHSLYYKLYLKRIIWKTQIPAFRSIIAKRFIVMEKLWAWADLLQALRLFGTSILRRSYDWKRTNISFNCAPPQFFLVAQRPCWMKESHCWHNLAFIYCEAFSSEMHWLNLSDKKL